MVPHAGQIEVVEVRALTSFERWLDALGLTLTENSSERHGDPMEVSQFAERNHLKLRHDSCGDAIIPGKPHKATRQEDRNHIYDNGDGRFGVFLTFPTVRGWNTRREAAIAAGFTLNQNAQTEGTMLFNPDNDVQAQLAIRLAGIKKVRRSSLLQLAAIAKARQSRRDPCAMGLQPPKNVSRHSRWPPSRTRDLDA